VPWLEAGPTEAELTDMMVRGFERRRGGESENEVEMGWVWRRDGGVRCGAMGSLGWWLIPERIGGCGVQRLTCWENKEAMDPNSTSCMLDIIKLSFVNRL